MENNRKYFTLVQYYETLDKWMIEFGDYDRTCVIFELEDYKDHGVKSKNLKIIQTSDKGKDINAAVDALNGYNPDLVERKVK